MRQNLLLWVRDYCNDPSLEDVGAIAIFLDRAVGWMQAHVAGVTNESLGDYSVSFGIGANVGDQLPIELRSLLRPYKKMKML